MAGPRGRFRCTASSGRSRRLDVDRGQPSLGLHVSTDRSATEASALAQGNTRTPCGVHTHRSQHAKAHAIEGARYPTMRRRAPQLGDAEFDATTSCFDFRYFKDVPVASRELGAIASCALRGSVGAVWVRRSRRPDSSQGPGIGRGKVGVQGPVHLDWSKSSFLAKGTR